jgi:hypothetical protein
MGRFKQKKGRKGSLKWIQVLVNDRPGLLLAELSGPAHLGDGEQIDWLSPLRDDDHAEYSDEAFLELLGVEPKVLLKSFWPKGGPHWDALGRSDKGKLFLIEAKAHVAEMSSSPTGARGQSRAQIRKSLRATRKYVASTTPATWPTCFYQYANRLAHLYYLRVLNRLPGYLVFVNFLNDPDMNGPQTRAEWESAYALLESFMGVTRHKLSEYIIHAYVDVDDLVD